MILRDMQSALQARYDVPLRQRVDDFFCNDTEHLKSLTGQFPDVPEMLLIHQQNDCLEITLFIDKSIMAAIHKDSLQQAWLRDNFDDVCIALEGVSHFVYLTWNASFGKPVKLLEMEIQAEVDKFVVAAAGLCTERGQDDCEWLIERLFQNPRFHEHLDETTRARYESANELALRYCAWLNQHYQMRSDQSGLHAELARFYRMSHRQKVAHIQTKMH